MENNQGKFTDIKSMVDSLILTHKYRLFDIEDMDSSMSTLQCKLVNRDSMGIFININSTG